MTESDADRDLPEPEFTPAEFEEKKYTEYFPRLQAAYKAAFQAVNEEYDSTLVHAIDQQVLSESDPSYEGDGSFAVALPEDPVARLEATDAPVDPGAAREVLAAYEAELERQLAATFAGAGGESGDADAEPKA